MKVYNFSFYESDLPIIREAMPASLEPLKSVGVFPTFEHLETFLRQRPHFKLFKQFLVRIF
jgi:hypothetical protein